MKRHRPARRPGADQTITPADTVETAAFIASAAAGLSKMAGAARLTTLSYLLNMVRLEAESQLNGISSPPN